MYRASKLRACPKWLTGDMKKEIEELYEKSRVMENHYVDHIISLQGKNVPRHMKPWNLQITSVTQNLRKSNKYDQY